MNFNPFFLFLAIFPLTCYSFGLSFLNVGKRPRVVAGVRDQLYLGLAVSGLLLIGPGQMIVPIPALVDRGIITWVLLFFLYFFSLLFLLGLLPQRIVVYNIREEDTEKLFSELPTETATSVTRAGHSYDIARLGVHFYTVYSPFFRNLTLVAAGRQKNNAGWKELEEYLKEGAATIVAPRFNCRCWNFLGIGIILATVAVTLIVTMKEGVIAGLLSIL